MGRHSAVALLLSGQRPDETARLLRYYDYFAQARTQKITDYQDQLTQIASIETRIQQALQDLRERKIDLEQQTALLLSQRKTREQALQRMRREQGNKSAALKQYQRNRKELEQVIVVAQRAMKRIAPSGKTGPFARMKGRLPWPVQGRPANRFGAARSGHMAWEGLMIPVAAGSPVYAIHGGRVVYADWLSGHGLLLIIDHGDGYLSLYAGNEVLMKEAGDWVQSGDTIARSGDAGIHDKAGLYFEIRSQGSPVDPRVWCR